MKLTALGEGITLSAKPGEFRLCYGNLTLRIANDGAFIREGREGLTLLRDACNEALTGWPEADEQEDAQ